LRARKLAVVPSAICFIGSVASCRVGQDGRHGRPPCLERMSEVFDPNVFALLAHDLMGTTGVGASVVCTWAVAFDFTNEAVDQRAPPRSAAKASVEAAVSVSKILRCMISSSDSARVR
jgi:hypothetical protein